MNPGARRAAISSALCILLLFFAVHYGANLPPAAAKLLVLAGTGAALAVPWLDFKTGFFLFIAFMPWLSVNVLDSVHLVLDGPFAFFVSSGRIPIAKLYGLNLVAAALLAKREKNVCARFGPLPAELWLLALFLFWAVTSHFGIIHDHAFMRLAMNLPFAWLVWQSVDRRKDLDRLMIVFAAWGPVLAAVSIAQVTDPSYIYNFFEELPRSRGLSMDANFNALFMTISFFSLLILAHRLEKGKKWFLAVVMAALTAIGILTTWSRGIILAAGCGGLILLLNRTISGRTAMAGITALILFMIPTGIALHSRVNTRNIMQRFEPREILGPELSSRMRIERMQAAYAMFSDHPVRGIGLGRFPSEYRQYSRPGSNPKQDLVHNVPIEILAETGVIGLFVWVTIFTIPARRLWRLNRLDGSKENRMRIAWAGSIFAVAICAMFFYSNQYFHYLWMCLMIGAILDRLDLLSMREKIRHVQKMNTRL